MEYECAFCSHTSKTRCGHHELQAEVGTLVEDNRLLKLRVGELQKKLDSIMEGVCKECKGGGEIGLADGEIPCPTCGGSGDVMHPGIFAKKRTPSEQGLIDKGFPASGFTEKRIQEPPMVVAHCRKCKHSTFGMVDECDTCKKKRLDSYR